MALEVIDIHGIPVYLYVPDNLPELPEGRRVDEPVNEGEIKDNESG